MDDTLDEIGGTAATGNMQQGEWYFVRYYADGTVKDASWVNGDYNVGNEYQRYVVQDRIVDAVDAIDDHDAEHVLLRNASESGLVFQNGTLYSSYNYDEGIWVSADVKVVRAQTVDSKDFAEIEYYEGRDGLEDALEDLNVTKSQNVEVSAIVEDGAAVVIVLNNTNDETTDEGTTTLKGDWSIEDAVVVDPEAGTEYINQKLDEGKNVLVKGDLELSETLIIPANTTLLVEGDLENNSELISNSGALKVMGQLNYGSAQKNIGGEVVAESIGLYGNSERTITGTVILKDLDGANAGSVVANNTNASLTIAKGAKLYANEGDGNITLGTGTLTNYGHIEWIGKITADNASDYSDHTMIGGDMTVETLTVEGGNVTVKKLLADTVTVTEGGDLEITASVANEAGSGDAAITVSGSGSSVDVSAATTVDAQIVEKDGGSANAGEDDDAVVKTYDVKVELRDKGPGKDGSNIESFDYPDAYESTGVTLDGTTYTVDEDTLLAYDVKNTIANTNTTIISQLTQTSGELNSEALFVGLAFEAPMKGAAKVMVEQDGKSLSKDGFTLSSESVDESGNDTYSNAFVKYLPYASVTTNSGDTGSTTKLGTIADNEYDFFFTWMDSEGNILGTSSCTISRVTE